MEEILKEIIKIAQPLYQNGELNIHQAIIINCDGVTVVQADEFVPMVID